MSNDSEHEEPVSVEKTRAPAARLMPGRFPLLLVLLPVVAAHLAASACTEIPDKALWGFSIAAGLAALIAAVRSKENSPEARASHAALFLPAVFCTALLAYRAALPAPPDRSGLPPREAVLTVRVDELFAARFGAISGIGTVTGAAEHLAELSGSRIQFRVTKHADDPDFDLGASVRLRGLLENAPEGDGFARYLRGRGVGLTLAKAKSEAVEIPASGFRKACTRVRERVAEALTRGVDKPGADRLAALMLGRTSLLPKSEREDFQKSGATHLFAISGLHITGIAAGLLWATRRLRIKDGVAVPLVLGALWFYVQMAGAPPSAMRAWFMAAAMFGALVLNRGARPAAGLVFAAVITLIANPTALRDPGFVLSYVVVAAILFYAGPAARRLETSVTPWRFVAPDALGPVRRRILKMKRPVFAACTTTFAATFAGAPLVAALFGNLSPIGLFANLALVPLAAPPVICGFIASAFGAAGLPAAAAPFNAIGAVFMHALAIGANLAASVPGGSFKMNIDAAWAPALAGIVVLVALLAVPVRPDRPAWRFAVLPAVAFGVLIIFACGTAPAAP